MKSLVIQYIIKHLIFKYPPTREHEPFLHQNTLSYVINIFNLPSKEHEVPCNWKHSTSQFTKAAISRALNQVPAFSFLFWDQKDTWFLPYITQYFTFWCSTKLLIHLVIHCCVLHIRRSFTEKNLSWIFEMMLATAVIYLNTMDSILKYELKLLFIYNLTVMLTHKILIQTLDTRIQNYHLHT